MLVVADTSALIALAACDTLSLLDHLFADVRVPVAVFRECTAPGKPETDRLEAYLRERVIVEIQAAGVRYGEQLVKEVLRLAGE
jgi:predicted nucleic acid-binding protein